MTVRLVLIFILTFFMVMDAGAQDRRRGDGDGRGGYSRDGGGGRGYGDRGARPRYYHAQRPGYRYRPGYGWWDPSAAVGTAIGVGVGNWLWRQWAQPEPPVVVVQPEPQPVGGMAYCINRYKSYDANPQSPTYGTYLGYDMQRHPCP